MRRPRAGDDNGDDRYGVRVDEPRRHLSSPLLPFSFSPPFSFFFFLLPFFSFLLSFLLFLLPPPPSYYGGGAEARGRVGRGASDGGAAAPAAAAQRLRRGGGAATARVCVRVWCVRGVCACVRFFYISNLFVECQIRGTRQRKYFAECPRSGTR